MSKDISMTWGQEIWIVRHADSVSDSGVAALSPAPGGCRRKPLVR